MIVYKPNTRLFLRSVQKRVNDLEDRDDAVSSELSEVDSEFLLDLARENLEAMERRDLVDADSLPRQWNTLDLVACALRPFFQKRLQEDDILKGIKPESHVSDMLYFLAQMLDAFPGLACGEKEVNGCDLVAWITERLNVFPHLKIVRTWPELEERFGL